MRRASISSAMNSGAMSTRKRRKNSLKNRTMKALGPPTVSWLSNGIPSWFSIWPSAVAVRLRRMFLSKDYALRLGCRDSNSPPMASSPASCPHFAWCNFWRIHRSYRVTPAMAVGATSPVWDLEKFISPFMTALPRHSGIARRPDAYSLFPQYFERLAAQHAETGGPSGGGGHGSGKRHR